MVERPNLVGLCAQCRHVRPIESDRGATFYLCRRATQDPRWEKYPRLPVHACSGYEPVENSGA